MNTEFFTEANEENEVQGLRGSASVSFVSFCARLRWFEMP